MGHVLFGKSLNYTVEFDIYATQLEKYRRKYRASVGSNAVVIHIPAPLPLLHLWNFSRMFGLTFGQTAKEKKKKKKT